MLDDLRALVEFAQAGSIAGAADRLYRTPSAITRQLQRLEAESGLAENITLKTPLPVWDRRNLLLPQLLAQLLGP